MYEVTLKQGSSPGIDWLCPQSRVKQVKDKGKERDCMKLQHAFKSFAEGTQGILKLAKNILVTYECTETLRNTTRMKMGFTAMWLLFTVF